MSSDFLYLKLARDLEKQIHSGKLPPGERLPSIRELATSAGSSINTVVMAYNLLIDKGLIYSKEKFGFFVSQDSQVKVPHFAGNQKKVTDLKVVDEVQWTLDSLGTSGITNLSAAVPDPELLPTKAISRFVKKHAHQIDSYAHPQGAIELRSALAKRLAPSWPSMAIGSDDIVITNGALEAIYITLKSLLAPGDVIAIENPTYYMYFKIIKSLGLKVVQVDSHPETGLCPDALEEALQKSKIKLLLCQPNFANPTGTLMSEERRHQIVELARKYNIILVQDDINGALSYDGRRHKALLDISKGVDSIYISSFSKTFSPGVRLGYLVGPNHTELFKQTKSLLTVAAELPFQLAMADYLTKGSPERFLAKIRPILASRFLDYKQFIAGHFPRGTAHTCPQGGFVLWVELPDRYDSRFIFKRALECNLSISPGTIFSADQSFKNFIRLNFAFGLEGKYLQAMKTLVELLK